MNEIRLMFTDTPAQVLQALLDKSVDKDPEVYNGVLKVSSPNFEWSGASGFANPKFRIPMQTEDQFQIASITKMITASVKPHIYGPILERVSGTGGRMLRAKIKTLF